ncbi:MAG: DEAD/DEAH box helicase family protein [Magnetococcales bacterium]|nr:DEAD/DEAH box helicase family protein [Magnetococcales bacterium]
MGNALNDHIGRTLFFPGHFETSVVLEEARPLGRDGVAGFECRVRLPDGGLEEIVISPEEAEAILGAALPVCEHPPPVSAEKLRLLIESARIRLAYAHDQQFAVSLSGIRTLPHQIEAVYQAMLPQPRLRFLLADDPGAGKTIMAGLLIKEMKLREAVDRVLILCPAPLTIQWQDELQRWFGESFDIIFSAVDQQQLTNPWQRSRQVIASLDYAKQDDVRERVWQQSWDLVIIDEAHKCSARTSSGGKDRETKVKATARYELAWKLSHQTDHLLLLTATPHHGDEDKFAHFLRLIDPDLFPEPHRMNEEAIQARKRVLGLGSASPWALRRLKEDLKDMEGRRLFPDRHATTVPFYLNSEEYALYQAVNDYINEFIPQRKGRHRSSAALTRTVFQRRLASSARAIHESLQRRLLRQKELLEQLELLNPAQQARMLENKPRYVVDAELEDDDLDDDARDRLLDDFTAAEQVDRLREEVAVLEELTEQSRRVREQAGDSKLNALRQCLSGAEFLELRDGRGKLLIFTEHRDTLNHVREHLEKWGYSVCEIHGGLNPRERKKAQEAFRTQAQVCVATEAAGEGINLQFCHLMINYDMPWNPTRLEQRMGRIHRIGQERDVYVFNFVATRSEDGQPVIEGRILQRLLEKMDEMREALSGRVFDVIGEVLSLNDVNLTEMLREAAHDPRRLEEYMDQIAQVDPERLRQYEETTGIALARSWVDFSGFQQRNLEVEEKRLMPRYVEAHFLAASGEVGLRVEKRADGLWRLEHVPASLRSERLHAVQKMGKAETAYRKVTFHKGHLEEDRHLDAELVGPGHPLYGAVDERLNDLLAGVSGGAGYFLDPQADAPYRLHLFELLIVGRDSRQRDVVLHGEVIGVRERDGDYELAPGDFLLNLPSHPAPPESAWPVETQGALDFLKTTRQRACRQNCLDERKRFAAICRDYLTQSFEARIRRAQERAMLLAAEAAGKSEYQFTADEARRQVGELERTRDERLAGLSRLETARTGPIRHLGTALVLIPDMETASQMESLAGEPDAETRRKSELAAEDRVIAELVAEGYAPKRIERLGHLKLGFDLRAHRVIDPASGVVEVKRIEVKGRMRGMPIRLTVNEWYKAQQLGESYWLYVVWDPLGKQSEVVKIQNPAIKLDHAKKEIISARFYEIQASIVNDMKENG